MHDREAGRLDVVSCFARSSAGCCDHKVKQKNVAFTLEEITHHGFTSRFCSYLKNHKSVFDNSTNENHLNFMEKNVRIPSEPHSTRATIVFRLVGRPLCGGMMWATKKTKMKENVK
jgi:hypothetical protein